MRWEDRGVSENIEDRRGQRGRFGLPGGGARVGCGTLGLLLLLSLIFRQNFLQFLDMMPAQAPTVEQAPAGQSQTSPEERQLVHFVSAVLNDAQATWARILPRFGVQYRDAKLVLFSGATQAACGFAQAATGPFYCPLDEKVYIDLAFYDDLRNRFGAGGDAAQAYVLAHEIAHHVQKVVGTEGQMRRAQQARPDLANELSVRLELQADCYSGVWANVIAREPGQHQITALDPGDIEEAMTAAAAVGDDRIQQQTQGYVSPESFTHGSSQQRVSWYRHGFENGDIRTCDTFKSR